MLYPIKHKIYFYFFSIKFWIQNLFYILRCFVLEVWNFRYMNRVPKIDIEPIFIIGAGRSGNTLLARILHEGTDVGFAPENYNLWGVYYLYLKHIREPWGSRVEVVLSFLQSQEDIWRWETMDFDKLKIKLKSSDERTLGNIIHHWYVEYLSSVEKHTTNWGCKTPNITPYMPFVIKTFPNLKCIYIIRNYLDVVSSYLNTGIHGKNIGEIVALIYSRYRLYFNFGSCQCTVVDYANIADNPEKSLNQIRDRFNLSSDFSGKNSYINPDTSYSHLSCVNQEITGSKKYENYPFDSSICNFLRKDYNKIRQDSILK